MFHFAAVPTFPCWILPLSSLLSLLSGPFLPWLCSWLADHLIDTWELSGKLVGFYWPLNIRLRKLISIGPEGNEEPLKVFELLGSVRLWGTLRRFSWPIRNIQKGHNNPKSQRLQRPRLTFTLIDNRTPRLSKLVTSETSGGFFSSTEQCPHLP